MKVLVTGAKGQVGSELIERGQLIGLSMIAVDIDELDITKQDTVTEYIKAESPGMVINAAAYTAVDKAEEDVKLAYAVNRDGADYLAKACAEVNIPLLHISTDYVFDGSKDTPYSEDDQPNPAGVYGKSKWEGEVAVAQKLGNHIILRVAWVFAASGHNFIRTMLRLAGERDELSVVADQCGAPTWAGDIADVLLNMAAQYRDKNELPWGTYHYIGAPDTTWHGFAQTIFDQAKHLGLIGKTPVLHAIATEQYPTPAERPKNSVLNCKKIHGVFNISQPDWRIGLKRVLTQIMSQKS